MDIDISSLKSREIRRILELYPQGHLETKYERVFWCADYSEPTLPNSSSPEALDPLRPPRGKGDIGATFQRMSNVLGSMVGPPPR